MDLDKCHGRIERDKLRAVNTVLALTVVFKKQQQADGEEGQQNGGKGAESRCSSIIASLYSLDWRGWRIPVII